MLPAAYHYICTGEYMVQVTEVPDPVVNNLGNTPVLLGMSRQILNLKGSKLAHLSFPVLFSQSHSPVECQPTPVTCSS